MVIGLAGLFSHLFAPVVKADTISNQNFMTRVEKNLGKITTLQVDFIQRRTLRLLQHQAIFTGKIFMQSPGKLAWKVYTPIKYSCIIDGDKMRQWDADSDTVTVLSAHKFTALQLVIRQLKYWFSGNFNALKKDFTLKIGQQAAVIEFFPKPDTQPARFIKYIKVKLRPDLSYIQQLTIYERGGDMMELNFNHTVINQTLPKTAWQLKK